MLDVKSASGRREAPWVLIAGVLTSFALGRYWNAPDSNYFFAALAAAVAFFTGLSLEPVRHRLWIDQERWRARLHAYSAMLASLHEVEHRLAATTPNVQQEPAALARAIQAVDQALQRVREAAALAAVLGDSLTQWFDEFEASISESRQRAYQSSDAWRAEVEAIWEQTREVLARAASLQRIVEVKGEALNERESRDTLHEYQVAVRNHGDAVKEHGRLVNRAGLLVALMPTETRLYLESFGRASRKLRDRLAKYSMEIQR